ncbi:hypothetical protein DL238_10505 [Alteriqipengyuania lutimaris]|uniref:Methyltransferase n=1 Tax=Alteriqipengyuania lutimaris TaxID=1538146 RepID=A0A395LTB6_9SPHN|nr:hypothetical protein DL238_10505 [Alteriqipengyuania lutimaris]
MARAYRHTALSTLDPAEQFLRAQAAEDVLERLDFMRFEACEALVVGDGPGLLRDSLAQRGFAVSHGDPGSLDEEAPHGGGAFGLIVSLFTLDTLNDLPGALLHYRNALSASGLFIAQFTGAGSLPALRRIMQAADGETQHARIHPQVDRPAASGLMSRAGFAKHVVDSHTLTVRYSALDRLVGDLRAQGLGSVLADAPPALTRSGLDRARTAFDALREDDGKVSETFEILSLTGWR